MEDICYDNHNKGNTKQKKEIDSMAANEKNRIIEEVTNDYLDGLDIEFPPTPETIEHDILTNVNDKFDLVKATTGVKWGRLEINWRIC